MTDPRAYMLILADAGVDEHPDRRLVKLLRTFGDYGFTLANAQGSDPPTPGLLETITLEHGVRYDDAGLAERLERLETTAIKRYLVRTLVHDAARHHRHAREMRGRSRPPIAIPCLGAGAGVIVEERNGLPRAATAERGVGTFVPIPFSSAW